MENEPDDLRALPREDAVHYVLLHRMDQLEKNQSGFDRWRVRADIVLDSISHIEARFETALKDQTTQILGELKSVKSELGLVVKDQTFWANTRTIARWIIGVSIPVVVASWAVFSWVYDHMHVVAK